MSIWHKEVIRVNGDLKAYIGVQNDWTGNVRYGIREIHLEGNSYYAMADGKHVDVTKLRDAYIAHEKKVEDALKWYEKTKF